MVAFLMLATGLAGVARAAADRPAFTGTSVLVIPIHGTIDEGMAHLVTRAVESAQRDGTSAIILDVNTFGGLVSSATEIRDALLASHVKTIAYVSERAWSAGALVTLSAQRIAMAPGSSIGAAEPIPKTVKTVSALRGEFESTAARNGRDPRIAAAMVDVNADAPQYKKTGSILTLKAGDAKRAGITDSIDPQLADVLRENHLANATSHTAQYTFGEQLARFATSPEVSGLLLTLGMLGLLIEMQTLHGIAGAIGIGSLALFFGTHVYAGFSNGLVIMLAVLGVLGILYELHVVPGHGAPGILGGIALLLAVLLAFGVPFFFVAVQSIAMAIVLTVIFFWLATKVFPENAWMRRLTFAGAQGAEYVTSSDFSALRNGSGVAASFLRPAGIASIDGKRVDVLTEGDFIPAGTPIRVTRVEGARIFVAPVHFGARKE
ncbi:MAG: ATP-dependent Clp protease proteolytic subunit [Candidatus Eremiobacteraeota bacterium]|nr:ATP-dependent Clp protease proteolytic subunit [Candidatus Eremiobacteraeota bacterium]